MSINLDELEQQLRQGTAAKVEPSDKVQPPTPAVPLTPSGTFDLDALEASLRAQPPAAPPEERGEFGKGLERGVLSLKALGHAGAAAVGGFFDEEFEQRRLADYQNLQKEMQALAPKVGRIEDISSTGDFFTWLAGVTGEQVPMLIGFAASGGLPGFITKKVAEKALTKSMGELAKVAAKKYATKAAFAGATTFGATVGTGEVYGEQEEAGVDKNRALAIGSGVLIGALDTFSFTKIAKAFGLGDAAKSGLMEGIKALPFAKRTLAMGALVGGTEAGTEALQEVTAIVARKLVDENYDTLGPEAKSRILNSAAAGFFVGGIPGAVGGAITKRTETAREKANVLPEDGQATVEEPTEEEIAEFEREVDGTPAGETAPVGPKEPLYDTESDAAAYARQVNEWEERGGFGAEPAPNPPLEQTTNEVDATQTLELLDKQLRRQAELSGPEAKTILEKELSRTRLSDMGPNVAPWSIIPEVQQMPVIGAAKGKKQAGVLLKDFDWTESNVALVGFDGIQMNDPFDNNAVAGRTRVPFKAEINHLEAKIRYTRDPVKKQYYAGRIQAIRKNQRQVLSAASAIGKQVQSWVDTFMPHARVIVSDGSVSFKVAETGEFQAVDRESFVLREQAGGQMWEMEDGTVFIEVNPEQFLRTKKMGRVGLALGEKAKGKRAAVRVWSDTTIDKAILFSHASHEFGHALTFKAWREAPDYVQKAVYNEYRRWLGDMQNLTLAQFVQRYSALPAVARIYDRGGFKLDTESWRNKTVQEYITEHTGMADYFFSFREYLAEQTSRYAQNSTRMQQPVQRFFAKVFATLKLYFTKFVKRYKPNVAFQTWLDWLAIRADLGVPLDPELSVPGRVRAPKSLKTKGLTTGFQPTRSELMENHVLEWLKNKPLKEKVVDADLAPYASRDATRIGVTPADSPAWKQLTITQSENSFNVGRTADEANIADGEVAIAGFVDKPRQAQQMADVLRQWIKEFSPGMKIVLTDTAPWKGAATTKNYTTYGSFTRDQKGVHYIFINRPTIDLIANPYADQFAFETLAHEFGHAIIAKEFSRATQVERKVLYQSYRKWLKDLQSTMTVREFFEQWSPYTHFLNLTSTNSNALDMPIKDWLTKQSNPEYYLSFDEFAANQIARYMATDGKGMPAAGFWRMVVKTLRKLYDSVKNRFRPSIGFRHFMDGLSLSAKHRQAGNLVASAEGLVAEEIDYETYLTEEAKKVESGIRKASKGLDAQGVSQVNDVKPAKFNWFMRLTLTLTQMAEQNLHIPGVKQYLETVRKWWTEKTRWTDRAQLTLEAWDTVGFSKTEAVAFDKLLLEATQKSDELGRALNEQEKVELFEKYKLNREEVHALYETIQLDFKHALDALFDVLEKDATIRFSQNQPALREALKKLSAEKAQLQNRDFFPLTRFGKYWTLVRASGPIKVNGKMYKAGETIEFKMYERESEMQKEFARLQRSYGNKMLTSAGVMSDAVASFQGMPRQLIETLRDKLELTPGQQEELDMLLHELAPGQSYKKHMLHRKGTAGFSEDAKRGYANYFMHFANHLSRVKHYHEMTRAFSELDDHIRRMQKTHGAVSVKEQQLRDWLDRHYEYSMNPGNEWANIRSFGFLWYLGFLPKSAFVNFTQVPLVTYPYLSARYGDAKTVKALTKAMTDIRKLWSRGKGLEFDLQQAIERGIEAGFLDESLATELAAVAEGSNLQTLLPGTFLRSEKGARMIRKASAWGAWMFQKAEKVNRLQTFAAAFRLAQESGMTTNESFEAARDAVEKTQFEYARWNRPEFMRGKKSVIFLFWQYMQNTLYFAATDQGRARFLFMMLMLAGLSGIPFAEDFMDILDFTMSKMKGALGWKNPKTDVRLALREFADDLGLHPDWVMHGLSRRTFGLAHIGEMAGIPIPNVDLSGSLSLGRIVPGVEPIFGREGRIADRFTAATTDVGGAAFSIPMSIMQALSDDNPDVFKRWERALPSALRSVSRAYRFATEGEETNRAGAKIVDFNVNDPEHLAEIIAQGLGAAPTRLNVERQLRWVQKEHAQYYQVRRGMLMEQFAYAIKTQDRETVARMKKRIRAYNESVPHPSLRISRGDLSRSFRSRVKTRAYAERGLPSAKRDIPLASSIRESFE